MDRWNKKMKKQPTAYILLIVKHFDLDLTKRKNLSSIKREIKKYIKLNI